MRIATWNVNSIRVRTPHVLAWLQYRQPDVLCLQELKVEAQDFPLQELKALGYHAQVWGQKTYNGVAILSRVEPDSVSQGLGDGDPQARFMHASIDGVEVLCAYFPNGGEVGSDKFGYKLQWMQTLREYLQSHFDPARDRVALCGDFNVALHDDDIARPEQWRDGVLACDDVREALQNVSAFGLHDVCRPFHPHGGVFSWWDYRGRGFERDNGLRIDHIFATTPLAQTCTGAVVDRAERAADNPSDHVPVIVEFTAQPRSVTWSL